MRFASDDGCEIYRTSFGLMIHPFAMPSSTIRLLRMFYFTSNFRESLPDVVRGELKVCYGLSMAASANHALINSLILLP